MEGESYSKDKHPCWAHVILENPGNRNACKCAYCGKVTRQGILVATQHLVGGNQNVKMCLKCPSNVREEMEKYQLMIQKGTEKVNNISDYTSKPIGEDRFEVDEDDVYIVNSMLKKRKSVGGGIGFGEGTSSGRRSISQIEKSRQKGHIDNVVGVVVDPTKVVRERERLKNMKQQTILENGDKEERDATVQYILRWVYQAGIPLNTVCLKSFHVMLEAIGQFGPGLIPPSYHEARVSFLEKELQYTNDLVKNYEIEWKRSGCSIMFDEWTKKDRTFINLLVHSAAGTMFLESVDASSSSKTGNKIFELLDNMVERIGEENVVQVVTDSSSNYISAGKFLEITRPHLYWTPCAGHCLDLILGDVGKLGPVERCLKRAMELTGYIYNRLYVLNLMREFTNQRELVRPAVTRFTTSFLTLSSIHKNKVALEEMFISEKWKSCKWSKDREGKKVTETVLLPSFWNAIDNTLKAMNPLVRVLRLVSGEKPAMGYIYGAMDRAKETIKKAFNDDEIMYKPIWEIIDKRWDCQLHRPLHAAGYYLNPSIFYDKKEAILRNVELTNGLLHVMQRLLSNEDEQNRCSVELELYTKAKGLFGNPLAIRTRKVKTPASWWALYGSSTPILQKLAVRVLNLTCSSYVCENNWSVLEHIHSKKRNMLDQKRVNDLIYIKYNQTLKERYDIKDRLDSISVDAIDDGNEWLTGIMEGDVVQAEDELVFDADDDDLEEEEEEEELDFDGDDNDLAWEDEIVFDDDDDDDDDDLTLEYDLKWEEEVARASSAREVIKFTRSTNLSKGKTLAIGSSSRV